MYYFIYYFSLFMIYSFGGWVIEMFVVSFVEKKIVNRGFLLGPYLPIYGIAGIMMTIILHFFTNNSFILFFNAILIGSTIEYITGYGMEKIFKAKWWDYSDQPFNLNGRICLTNSILFGLLGTILVYFINPFLYFCLDAIPTSLLYFIAGLLLSLFVIDCVLSFNVVKQLKLTAAALKKDYSDEMSHKVREALATKGWTFKRILNAFPDLTFINMKEFKKIITTQAKILKEKTRKLAKLNQKKKKIDKKIKNLK